MEHSFDIEVSSHDDLKEGIVAKRIMSSQHTHHRIVISGEYTEVEAAIIACQMGNIWGMTTACYIRI